MTSIANLQKGSENGESKKKKRNVRKNSEILGKENVSCCNAILHDHDTKRVVDRLTLILVCRSTLAQSQLFNAMSRKAA